MILPSWASSSIKNIVKIVVNNSIGIKMNIIQAGLYLFFYSDFKRN